MPPQPGGGGGSVRTPCQGRARGIALWKARGDVLLPVVIRTSLFGGFATRVEAAALTVLDALIVACRVDRELRATRDIARVAIASATMVGVMCQQETFLAHHTASHHAA